MTLKALEQRVLALEKEVQRLTQERAAASGDHPDWRRAVEKWRGDEDVLAVLREGMKLREKERRAVRRKQSKPRRKSA